MQERAKETGFHIPVEELKRSLEEIPDNLDTLKPDVDFFCSISNAGGDFEIDGCSWKEFTTTFQQEVEVIKSLPTHGKEQMERRLASAEETRYCANSFRMRRRSLRRPFRVHVSTEENHRSDDRNFYGKYSHIRETLDYAYHCNYTYERQKLQDSIITEFLHAAVITDKDGQVCSEFYFCGFSS